MTLPRIKDGETFQVTRLRSHRLGCCDCGLVHDLEFKIRRIGAGHKLFIRATRNARATAAERRGKAA